MLFRFSDPINIYPDTLPFQPKDGQFIYVEPQFNPVFDVMYKRMKDAFNTLFASYHSSLIYLPDVIQEIAEQPETNHYFRADAFKNLETASQLLLTLLPEGCIKSPSLISFLDHGTKLWVFDLDLNNLNNSLLDQFYTILNQLRHYLSMTMFDASSMPMASMMPEESMSKPYKKEKRLSFGEKIKKKIRELAGETEEERLVNRRNSTLESSRHKQEETCGELDDLYYNINIREELEEKYYDIKGTTPANTDLAKKTSTSHKTADDSFNEETLNLLDEAKRLINRLRRSGVEEWVLRELIKANVKLSRLVITPSYHIVLPDYDELEINMAPMPRAVYMLFLRHKEGIPFKSLPDYSKELLGLYQHVCRVSDMDVIAKSIERVTNPYDNSINEKCARIREAFLKCIDDEMAHHYYITGRRGEPKRITLDRELIEWQPSNKF